ncbi:SDR family oxidoreductase [Nocardioides seonyuensis]|uniref:SDR family oxidoreductase n=1 Tax=Nocardioides seonyuensis TaxID=2518371 RepID=UPI001ABE6703|nr:SDR family oxidoreductase [Nocardioides seonyuensis]
MPAQVSYSSTKAALLGFVKSVAAENITPRITANGALPVIASSGVLSMPQEIVDAWAGEIPNGLVGPADIAAAVALPCPPSAESVGGQFLTVDGGIWP